MQLRRLFGRAGLRAGRHATLFAGCLVLSTAVLAFPRASADAASSNKVLILAGTVTGAAASIEASEAQAKGLTVEIVSGATWASMSASEFASYRALIFGDPTCANPTTPDIDAAATNAKTWGPVVNGNIVIIGTDPVYHASQGGETLTRRGVDFAIAQEGKTGAYITLSCYYHNTAPGTPVPLLDGIGSGSFTVTGVGCYNDAHIVASSPALAGLTDADLSNWSCSVHEAFQSWPAGLIPLAIAKDFDSSFTASDGTQGPPYILAGGDIRSFPLSLSPLSASAPAGSSHTVTATLLDGQTRNPLAGARIGFEVSAGPNAGASGSCNPSTCLTNASGEVRFSYQSNGTTGTDTIRAFYDQNDNGNADVGEPVTSAGVEWTQPPDPACEGIYLVGARGSGETSRAWDGYGSTIYIAKTAFLNRLGPGYKVQAQALDYPSRSVSVLISKGAAGVFTFLDGVDDGIDKLLDMLERKQRACPGQPIVLFGYSQGALVINQTLRLLGVANSPVLENVAGVGLIADPHRLGTANYTLGSANPEFNGVSRTFNAYPAADLPAAVQRKTVSWCNAGDYVCAWNWTLRLLGRTGEAHASYRWNGDAETVGKIIAAKVAG